MFPSFARILSLCLCLAAWSAAQEAQDTTIPCPESGCPPVPAHILSTEAMESYLDGRYDWALSQFDEILETTPGDSLSRVGQVMALRRLGQDSLAVVRVRGILHDNPRDAAAALAYSQLLQPQRYNGEHKGNADSSWHWAQRAVSLDPNSTDAWMVAWVEAMMLAKDSVADQAIRQVARLKLWTDADLALCRWMLQACPPRAILFLSGDMDLFATRQLQVLDGLRPDVQIQGTLLESPRYCRNRIRAGLLPTGPDSLWIDSAYRDTTVPRTLAQSLLLRYRKEGKWPVAALSCTKTEDGWETVIKDSRDLIGIRILDGRPGPARWSELKPMIDSFLAIPPTLCTGPAYMPTNMSPLLRAYPGQAYNLYLLATTFLHNDTVTQHKQVVALLTKWRRELAAIVPKKDDAFQRLVEQVAQIEATTAVPPGTGKSTKGKAKARR